MNLLENMTLIISAAFIHSKVITPAAIRRDKKRAIKIDAVQCIISTR